MSYTPASQWKKRERLTKSITLVSGNTVLIRKCMPLDFMKTGIVPTGLDEVKDQQAMVEEMKDHVVNMFATDPEKIFDIMVMSYVLAPQIVDGDVEPGEDQLHISDLTDTDKIEILHAGNKLSGFTQEALAEANFFRGEELANH